MLLRLVGHTLGLPGVRLASVLDPSPLAGSLDRWIDWRRLERNMRAGHADAVCVVATMLSTGKPVGFVASHREVPSHAGNEIRYVKTRLRSEHIRASAAIPVLFPTVEVTAPRAARGHYTDGGTRLNSPIKPAVDLGADKVIVIGFEPFGRAPEQPAAARQQPSIADVAANVLDGLLVDQVAHDLRRVAAINSFFVENHSTGPIGSPRTYRIARGLAPYRPISYALVAPKRRGEIGRLAETTFKQRYGGLRGIRTVDFGVMARARSSAPLARRVTVILAVRRAVHSCADRDGQARRAALVAAPSERLVPRGRARPVDRTDRSRTNQGAARDRRVPGASNAPCKLLTAADGPESGRKSWARRYAAWVQRCNPRKGAAAACADCRRHATAPGHHG